MDGNVVIQWVTWTVMSIHLQKGRSGMGIFFFFLSQPNLVENGQCIKTNC